VTDDAGGSGRDEVLARIEKVEALREHGVDPYPVHFARTYTCAALQDHYADLTDGSDTDDIVHIAGRMMLRRGQGKLSFATVRDGSGEVQLFVSKGELGDDAYAAFGGLDLGDWVGATGTVMRTRKGELSVKVTEVELLAKALRPMPDKWHGLSDVDTRFRQRYVDLIVNDEARRVFEIRSAAVQSMRQHLLGLGYREVETPVLQPVWGGALARPFITHHNALDTELFLRIAPELYLKRLIVAGFEKVFEIGRVFRNEGLSTRHNPEFTMLELYEAFVDYHVIAARTEDLIAGAAQAAIGTTKVQWSGHDIDLTPPFRRATLIELVREHAGVDMHPKMPVEEARAICERFEIPWKPSWGSGKLLLEVYEKTTEHAIVEPTFVMDYPREVSPLARVHRSDPDLTERFELIVAGREIANAFSELNDPVEQRRRFEAQLRVEQVGDDRAQPIDEDYIRALEYGLPPCGGLGVGIDRVVMLIAGVTSIREVILFPHMRPEATP
jgi:lysyl-tRNA synthetase class 2